MTTVVPFPSPVAFTNDDDLDALRATDPTTLTALAALLEDAATAEVVWRIVMDARDQHPRADGDIDSCELMDELARRLRLAAAQATT